jgi:hypothetical protein
MADIEYKTPQDVADEKARKKAGAAYDKAMPEPDTTTGNFEGYRKQKQGEIAERKAKKYLKRNTISQLKITNGIWL